MSSIASSRLGGGPNIQTHDGSLNLYKHRELWPEDIRLIQLLDAHNPTKQLRCTIRHAGLAEVIKEGYSALSYTWGANIFDHSLMVQEWDEPHHESLIKITKNLDFALRRIRADGKSGQSLWVDAICINQSDAQERTDQVRMMYKIFAGAFQVLCWTGLDNNLADGEICLRMLARLANGNIDTAIYPFAHSNRDTAFRSSIPPETIPRHEMGLCEYNFLRQLADDAFLLEGCPRSIEIDNFLTQVPNLKAANTGVPLQIATNIEKVNYDVLTRFFRRPYFSRRWIIQEISAAKRIIFYCGRSSLGGEEMFEALRKLFGSNYRVWSGFEVVTSLLAMRGGFAKGGSHLWTPLKFLADFTSFQCGEPKDHVLSMLGMLDHSSSTEIPIPNDLSYLHTVEELYTTFACYQLSHENGREHEIQEADCTLALSQLLSFAGSTHPKLIAKSLSTTRTLPSWVPDWRVSFRYEFTFRRSARRDSMKPVDMPSPWTRRGCWLPNVTSANLLKVFGLQVDRIEHRIDIIRDRKSSSANARKSALCLEKWQNRSEYQTLYGSVHELISDLLVSFYHETGSGGYVSSWVQDNRRQLFGSFSLFGFDHPEGGAPELPEFIMSLSECLNGRCIVFTENWYIGIACEDARVGDNLVVLAHSPVLFLFREKENNLKNSFELVGDAYIHGFNRMAFEEMDPEELFIH